jgi:drug/metabolite transporter (DMT)-like permease
MKRSLSYGIDPPVILALVILGMIWGFSFLFIKVIVREINPWLLAAGRLWMAALALLPVILFTKRKVSFRLTRVPDLIVASAFNFTLPYFLIPWGEQYITSGQASVLNATMPFFTILLGWWWFRHRPAPVVVLGVAVGFGGILLLAGGTPAVLRATQIPGQGAVLLAALSYAASAHFIHRRLLDLDLLGLTFITLVGGALMATPAAVLSGMEGLGRLGFHGWASWIGLGVLCTSVAYLIYLFIISRAGATTASLVTYLFPAFALFWGWLLLGEALDPATLGGTLLIFMGVFLAGRR